MTRCDDKLCPVSAHTASPRVAEPTLDPHGQPCRAFPLIPGLFAEWLARPPLPAPRQQMGRKSPRQLLRPPTPPHRSPRATGCRPLLLAWVVQLASFGTWFRLGGNCCKGACSCVSADSWLGAPFSGNGPSTHFESGEFSYL